MMPPSDAVILFEKIDAELAAVGELREKPAGTIRISAGDHAIHAVIWPKLTNLLRQYPDIKVEISIDYGLTDIVAERYDAGVRLGEQVAKDMIAVRIAPDVRFVVVGAKSYFAKHRRPGLNSAGSRTPHLYQLEVTHARRALRLGIRAGRAGAESARRRATRLQQHFSDSRRGGRRLWTCLRARGSGAALSCQGASGDVIGR